VDDLGENFKQCIDFRDAKTELLSKYNSDFNVTELGKLAIDYSDGIIVSGKKVGKELVDYAKKSGTPLLTHKEDFADAYESFYDMICPDKEEAEEE
jgi:starch synthase